MGPYHDTAQSQAVQAPVKPGRVTTAGKPSDDVAPAGRHSGNSLLRYAVVIEKAGNNYSAYVLDLPSRIATGETVAEVERKLRDAIRFHIDGLKEDGLPVPPPSAVAEYVEA